MAKEGQRQERAGCTSIVGEVGGPDSSHFGDSKSHPGRRAHESVARVLSFPSGDFFQGGHGSVQLRFVHGNGSSGSGFWFRCLL